MSRRTGRSRGFTLVEIIIVIIILGILAALAIPQFTDASQDAREATLAANLAVMRNAINLYYHEHGSEYPGAIKTDGSGSATAPVDNPAAFVDQMTAYSSKDGEASTTLDRANYPFGPYMATGIPENPINTFDTVTVLDKSTPIVADDITDKTGWLYNKQTGELRADSEGYIKF